MDWAQILVTLLAVLLAIFLALGVALLVLLIKLTRQIKAVASVAERTVQNIEKTTSGISKVTSPLLLAKLVARNLNIFKKHR